MTAREICDITEGELKNLTGEEVISDYSTDSREISDNSLFIPIVGERANGHSFFNTELAKRGIVSLWNKNEPLLENLPVIVVKDTLEALYKLAHHRLEKTEAKVIGISGSNGKTSVKDFLFSILSKKFKTHSNRGNLNTDIGLSLTLLSMPLDTEYAVLEMGVDHFGDMELLSKIAPPSYFILTNVGEAHLDDLKTKEGIARAKTEFVENLTDFENSAIFYNGDDAFFKKALEARKAEKKAKLFTFGYGEENDFFPIIDEDGERIIFHLNKNKNRIRLNAIGRHQALNAAAAFSLAYTLGIEASDIIEGLEGTKLSGFRTELTKRGKFTFLNDAYKSNPSSLRAGLEAFYALEGYSQKIAVLGDMLGIGEDVEAFHSEIGEELDFEKISLVFTMGNFSKKLHQAATRKFGDRACHFEDRKSLIEAIRKNSKEGVLIFLKASNSEKFYELIEEVVYE